VAGAVKVVFLILCALFPIVDPLSGSPFILVLTQKYSP
jgi:small neutral amino acid transporter SnatA (MarC family)